jgi:hypothetical protein
MTTILVVVLDLALATHCFTRLSAPGATTQERAGYGFAAVCFIVALVLKIVAELLA